MLYLPKHQGLGAYKQQEFTSHGSRSFKSEIRAPARSGTGESPPLGCRLCLHTISSQQRESKGVGRGSWRPFHKERIPCTRLYPPHLRGVYLLKIPSPLTSTLGLRCQHVDLGGHKHAVHCTFMSPDLCTCCSKCQDIHSQPLLHLASPT